MHTSIVTHLNTLYTNKSSMQFINPSPTRSPLYGPTNCLPTCKLPVQILILASVLFELLIYRPLSNIRKATNEPFSERFLLTWVIWNCQISQFKTHFWSMKEEKRGAYTWHVGDSLLSFFSLLFFSDSYTLTVIRPFGNHEPRTTKANHSKHHESERTARGLGPYHWQTHRKGCLLSGTSGKDRAR